LNEIGESLCLGKHQLEVLRVIGQYCRYDLHPSISSKKAHNRGGSVDLTSNFPSVSRRPDQNSFLNCSRVKA
jgi:hypothetical protein